MRDDDSLRFPIACLIILLLLLAYARWFTGEWIWQDPDSGRAHFQCPLPARTYYQIYSHSTGTAGPWRLTPEQVCPVTR